MISKAEVLRYLAAGELDYNLDKLIDDCIIETEGIVHPKHVYRVFDIEDGGLRDTDFYFEGNDIKRHLDGCKQCILLASTTGIDIDRLIRKYEFTNITKALIIDACSSVAVEKVQSDAMRSMPFEFMTFPYSAGYGDFPIYCQNKIADILQTQKTIGLTVTRSHIMIPRKSITSVIGISEKPNKGKLAGCGDCNLCGKCIYGRLNKEVN